MEWTDNSNRVPVLSWCKEVEPEALKQAANLANHPAVFGHVALMPDCHVGYGMPIGGVVACADAVIPNAVGVDIGCGMVSVRTDLPADRLGGMKDIRRILERVKARIPVGEGNSHSSGQDWEGFERFKGLLRSVPGWLDSRTWELALKNLGTLGGGNHFIEIQRGEDGSAWLMLHSGSRNLGYRIASFHHRRAVDFDGRKKLFVPSKDLAYFPADSDEGREYVRDMEFALEYALENRRRMMHVLKEEFSAAFPEAAFLGEINIHHNYAALERHLGLDLWVHRKGATSAKEGETGIIPGSMGTASYIVKGLGNPMSFTSCSHGAGRALGRSEACRRLSIEACDRAMEGIVYDRWGRTGRGKKGGMADLSEAPAAYKDIDTVIRAELDLVAPEVRLTPIGVIKG